ncbi:Acyl transferase domain-containing protein [Prauserella aidingensis]|uniref:SDR family NAD(P)-dependent oxidoreductase n=1 Tax=Prauserella aidingensis TaxID=387890 RepID=UPI0020A517AA|nr:SDR family NAD(P)-dependent oxidoreductase [Prauserella aidingensis]MCP2251338.1 Acyl transferase domain-containing protein [Prauserella aidingensis]
MTSTVSTTQDPALLADRLAGAARTALEGADPGAGLVVQQGMDALTVVGRRLLAGAVRSMGAFAAPGERAGPAELADRIGVVDRHRALFDTLLDVLVTAGTLQRDAGDVVAPHPLRELSPAEVASMIEGIEGEFPGTAPMARLVGRCVPSYPEVLTGRRSTADVLFPGGDPPVDGPGDHDAVSVVAAVVEELVRGTDGAVSITELGAGAGGATGRLLPAVEPFADRVRYSCTDPSPWFVEDARRRFGGGRNFVDFSGFDITVGPAAQGATARGTDVLVAANVLHAVDDIDAALGNAAELVRPGGALVLAETVSAPEPLVMVFGLTERWWPANRSMRLPGSPLLSADDWTDALVAAGFTEVRVHPLPPGSDAEDAPEAVIVAIRSHDGFGPSAVDTGVGANSENRVAAGEPGEAADVTAGPHGGTAADPVASTPPTPPTPAPEAERVRFAEREGAAADDPVAIVGMSVRFPGAPDARAYWDLVSENRGAIDEIPARRWDWRRHYTPNPQGIEVVSKSHSKWGAFLDDFDRFDAEFFGMSDQEARNTDPQQRIFLQECWKAMEDAGYCPHGLDANVRRATGVFAGASKLGFDRLGPERGVELPRTSFGDMVNRVSYHLDLGGPSKPVDTACSSALVALHEAAESLRSGECAMALVGGVNLYLHPSTYAELGAVKMLSSQSECPAFGIGGNGIVPGEGVGVMVLKRLGDAERDKDDIRAVIRGTAVNHNGRTVGFTSPNPKRQADVMTAALRRSGVDADTIGYLETTVNGTEIGDAVEMSAVTQVFGGRREETAGTFRIGSVKPNIGHGEASSGMAQLAKVVLALRERTFPPTRVPAQLNPAIDTDKLPFELSAVPAPWEPPVVDGGRPPRRAGVTGIGAGGANAHAVVEEAPAAEGTTGHGPALFVLSARTPEQLEKSADNWIAHLRAHPGLDLERVAYTTQVGREPMRHRLALVAESIEGVVSLLERWRSGTANAVETGEATRPPTAVRAERAKGRTLHELARVWASGGMIAWSSVHQRGRPRRLGGLPTYPFAETSYWVDPPEDGGQGRPPVGEAPVMDTVTQPNTDPVTRPDVVDDHPMLDPAGATTFDDGTVVVTATLSLTNHPWLGDHVMNGRVLLPGTAIVDLVCRAGDGVGTARIDELTLQAPLDLTNGDEVTVRITFGAPAADGRRTVDVTSRPVHAVENRPWSRHAGGTCSPRQEEAGFGFAEWPPPGAQALPMDDYYRAMDAAGYTYGPSFQSLRAVWARGAEVFAEVELPAERHDEARRYGVHPALLDSSLHAMGFGAWADGGGGLLPFAWTGMAIHAPGCGPRARVRLAEAEDGGVHLQLADSTGRPVAHLDSLVLRSATGRGPDLVRDALLVPAWYEVDTAGARASAMTWTLLGADPFGLASAVDAREDGDYVVFSCPDRSGTQASGDVQVSEAHEATGVVLDSVRDWLTDPANRGRTLVVVTRRAIAVEPGEDVLDLATAPVWGILRTAQSEYQRRLVLVDIDTTTRAAEIPAAVAGAVAADELHLAVRRGRVLVPRLAKAAESSALGVPDELSWRLDTTAPGTLDGLSLVPAPDARRPLAAGQVRVAVRAATLNFRDVLGALGLYPGDLVLGAEGAGVITEIGPGVTGFARGDRIFGLLPGGIGPVCVADVRTVRHMPAGWSFTEAAATPVAYLTAYYGLCEVADLRAGESVLVHAAAGGVGSAAVHLASWIGADVFATAGSAKHGEVERLGVPAAMISSSRDTRYADTFLAGTSGRGVDVVLNSLTGEHVEASLSLLPRGGRFVEMGKTGIRESEDVARQYPGVRYTAFDLVEAGPERIDHIFDELLPLFERGELPPPTRTVFDVRNAREAMRLMSGGGHVGRVVLTMPRSFAPGGTVVITGGTGTIGSVVARNLVTAHGVRHLVLASRRGEDAPGAEQLVADLTARGADVSVVRCDATDRGQVSRLLAGIPEDRPLTGVVQVVGALDDGMLAGQTRARLEPVLAAKIDSAVLIDELTREADPDVFVTFSGAAGVLGNPGQANYAAANSFLDALARRRRHEGRAATSIAFGLWATESDLTRDLDEAAAARMASGGFRMLSDEEGMRLFDAALADGADVAVPMKLDVPAMRSGPVHPVLRRVAGLDGPSEQEPTVPVTSAIPVPAAQGEPQPPDAAGGAGTAGHRPLIDRLAGAEPARRRELLLGVVAEQVAAVLEGFRSSDVEADTGFAEIGFDSLTAVELRNRLDEITGLTLPVTLVFDQATAGALAGHLLDRLSARISGGPSANDEAKPAERLESDAALAGVLGGEHIASAGAIADVGGGGGDRLAELAARQGDAVVHTLPADPDVPLPATYDLVVLLGGLASVRRKRELFARIDAALIDGGRLVVSDHVGTLRGDLDDPASGLHVASVDTWVGVLGSARLVLEELAEPDEAGMPGAADALAEPRRRGWVRPVAFRLLKDTAAAAAERDSANHHALTAFIGAGDRESHT